jgi:hypothetical protein
MKAVRLLEYGGQLVFDEVPTPTICSCNYFWCVCTADIVPILSRSLQWECVRVSER